MKKLIFSVISALALSLFLVAPYLPTYAATEEQKSMCVNLIRHGKEELQRKKFNQAKKKFREAIQVDPANKIAWKYYDQAVIFALAAKVQMDDSLTKMETDLTPTTNTLQPGQELKEDTTTNKSSGKSKEEEEEEEEGC